MKLLQTLLISFFSLSLLSGCAPSLGSSVDVHKINATTFPGLSSLEGKSFNVLEFDDNRASSHVAQIEGGRSILPNTPVGEAVQRAMQRYLRENGLRVSRFDAPTIAGSVNKWDVRVRVNFPSSFAAAYASIMVDILDKKDKVLFRKKYTGSVQTEHPAIESKVEEVLGEAMEIAIGEAYSDREFVAALEKSLRS